MRIVSLSDNETQNDKLFSENGLCFYIEHKDKTLLFGAGASGIYAENAKRLGIDAQKAQALVLPHNHTTCAGGAELFAKKNADAPIFIKRAAAAECAVKSTLGKRHTGLSPSFFKNNLKRCVCFNSFSEVAKDFFLVSNEAGEALGEAASNYYIKHDRGFEHDDFSGEIFGVCFPKNRRDGCVILTCCSHSGIIGMIKTVTRLWDTRVKAIVGGFGFFSGVKQRAPTEEIKQTAEALDSLDIGNIYTCHCTGVKGYEMLKETLDDQIQYLHVGEELEF